MLFSNIRKIYIEYAIPFGEKNNNSNAHKKLPIRGELNPQKFGIGKKRFTTKSILCQNMTVIEQKV